MTTPPQRPRIALLDYAVNSSTPNGTCYLRLLEGLHDSYDFTVFSAAIDNPDPASIRWEPVRVIRRPLVALFSSFYVASVMRYRKARRHGREFDLVQIVEGNAPLGE